MFSTMKRLWSDPQRWGFSSSLAKQYKRARLLDNESVITPVIPSNEEELFLGKNSHENKFLDSYLIGELHQIYRRDFLLVNFQLFCQADLEDGGDFYPAEMAIMRYSFQENVKDEFYTIIKPEKFPVGYTGTAIDLSRETHQIPPFDFIAAHGDYYQIWRGVQRVIGDSEWITEKDRTFLLKRIVCLESLFKASSPEPIMIFCNAFERDQTTYLLNWLASKDPESDEPGRKPRFDVYSFEALVAALLRRLGHGDFAHQGVREQLRRPVYTLQIRDRCVYHDSLAIQHCSRAVNHGFRLFLNDFIRQRLVELLPESVRQEINQNTASQLSQSRIATADQASSVNRPSTPSVKDSISSIFIEQQGKGPCPFVATNDYSFVRYQSKLRIQRVFCSLFFYFFV